MINPPPQNANRPTYLLARYPCETFIGAEIEALRKHHHLDPRILSLQASKAADGQILPGGMPLRLSMPARRRLAHLLPHPRQFLALLRRVPALQSMSPDFSSSDHLHAQFAFLPADAAFLLAELSGATYSVALHAADIFTQGDGLLMQRLKSAAFITACTQQGVDRLSAIEGLPRVHLVRHGVEMPGIEHTCLGPPLILAAGRLVRKKGFDTLLEACHLLTGRGVPCQCKIVGNGPERHTLRRHIRSLQLDSSVTVHDAMPQPELFALMATASAFVLPSRRLDCGDRDGLANVLLEAMALGTPVISTNAGAAGEAIEAGETGLLVPADNPEALSKAVHDLLTDEKLCSRIVQQAKTHVASSFSPGTCTAPLAKLLKAMLV